MEEVIGILQKELIWLKHTMYNILTQSMFLMEME